MLRRDFVKAAALSPFLLGAKSKGDLQIAQLKTGGTWNPRPDAMRRLLWEVVQRTSIESDLNLSPLAPEDRELFKHPFLYWAGSGALPPISDAGVRNLRRYLSYGGTLLIDSADGDPKGAYDQSVRTELKRILPGNELVRLPGDHILYSTFYLVDSQAGRVLRVPYLGTVGLEKRQAIIYTQNDLGGAWARDSFGRWEHQVTPGGDRQRELAFRLGINIVMYALCLDYKRDLVHAPFLVKRRR